MNELKSIQSRFQISYKYDVHFTNRLFDLDNPLFREALLSLSDPSAQKKILVIIDSGFFDYHPNLKEEIKAYFDSLESRITLVEEILLVPGGENCKNDINVYESLIDAVDRFGIDRHSFIMCIGGGALLDLVGYVAATSHRGIRLIRIPTTVLSQNDSGVGVKNSINFKGKKNFLGTFAPPALVINDFTFLQTLNDRDWRSGIAEAIKVALIKDASFFNWLWEVAPLLSKRDLNVMSTLIERCARLHVEHIASGDPFESGSSRPLDFGHWSAHKLEYLTNFEMRHGEAVAIGMAIDTVYSNKVGMLSNDSMSSILNLLLSLGFKVYHDALSLDSYSHLEKALNEFREHLGGRLTIMLLREVGTSIEIHQIDKEILYESVHFLKKYQV
ncbi:MAG: 3-dehydroquinate synthase [Leptospira sp.]|nr:3-dehydroquinate synthase [Leptospira sp.]